MAARQGVRLSRPLLSEKNSGRSAVQNHLYVSCGMPVLLKLTNQTIITFVTKTIVIGPARVTQELRLRDVEVLLPASQTLAAQHFGRLRKKQSTADDRFPESTTPSSASVGK